jgi:ferritin-like metal-binding protein YciE
MPKKLEGLEQLLVEELQDLFDAEKQLVRALPKMAKSASDEELENAFREHLEVTKGQVQRLEQVFESMEVRAKSKPCHGMKGLVEEGQEIMQDDRDEMVLDSGLIGAARKVEHYEMAGYESARLLAQQLGMRDAAQLLQETLREEMETDRLLATISKRLLKDSMAQRKSMQQEEARGSSETRGRSQRGGASGARAGGSSQSRGRASQSGARTRSSGKSAQAGGARKRGSQRNGGGSAQPLTDHEEIRQWAEERGGTPACVRGTGDKGDIGMLRLDFPGYSGEQSLQPISWDDWLEKFDERGLALIVQEKTASGQKSNFNKLISRQGAAKRKPKAKSAR